MPLLKRRSQTPGPDGLTVSAGPGDEGLEYIDFAAHDVPAGATLDRATQASETALVILGGRCSVHAGDQRFDHLGERDDVWAKTPPYVVLFPPGTPYAVRAETELKLVIAAAPVGDAAPLPPRVITPDQIAAENRGAGQTYRYIQHLLPPSADAARLILVEVYTPAGNWSSFPPHKHDTETPPAESLLEETYYFRVSPPTGFALQRVYTPDRSVDEPVAPGDGDLVLVPRGYHPVAATPGHDCYYLNVMAGPTRLWNFQVDPDYAHLMNWAPPAAITR
ncbi:MAG TPA: 5-deoxy-glucuronate isomerase [Chloroflexota bacterium]|nr:5-deoxy-glucuronate isomerase [Chloroflexota bacterium]